jgi:hypothetical protein
VFPEAVQTYVVMAAGVRTGAARAARDFVSFLSAASNDAVVRAKGMQRVR